ncbi:polymer-forming cytoskeletal protein [Desulfococcaceae bacterium HSG8]|nr:polymer-forming cytoskeletal protein [Desulfococcaceae bacterium HSG8]
MTKKTENFSILDRGLTVEGTISCKGKIIIKGTVKGTFVGENVVIGEEGAVYADMKAGSVTVGGIFEGKVRALEELVVLSTGNCEGKVVCRDIIVEPGGILNADVSSLKVQEIPATRELPGFAPKKELPAPLTKTEGKEEGKKN